MCWYFCYCCYYLLRLVIVCSGGQTALLWVYIILFTAFIHFHSHTLNISFIGSFIHSQPPILIHIAINPALFVLQIVGSLTAYIHIVLVLLLLFFFQLTLLGTSYSLFHSMHSCIQSLIIWQQAFSLTMLKQIVRRHGCSATTAFPLGFLCLPFS